MQKNREKAEPKRKIEGETSNGTFAVIRSVQRGYYKGVKGENWYYFEQDSEMQVVMINQYRLLGIWTDGDESRMNDLQSIGQLILCVLEIQHDIALLSQSPQIQRIAKWQNKFHAPAITVNRFDLIRDVQ